MSIRTTRPEIRAPARRSKHAILRQLRWRCESEVDKPRITSTSGELPGRTLACASRRSATISTLASPMPRAAYCSGVHPKLLRGFGSAPRSRSARARSTCFDWMSRGCPFVLCPQHARSIILPTRSMGQSGRLARCSNTNCIRPSRAASKTWLGTSMAIVGSSRRAKRRSPKTDPGPFLSGAPGSLRRATGLSPRGGLDPSPEPIIRVGGGCGFETLLSTRAHPLPSCLNATSSSLERSVSASVAA